jgi:hypothetical protein
MTKHLWGGSNGCFLKQITDPKINGLNISNSPEQVKAIGPGMVWNHGEWFLYVNGHYEFEAENRAIHSSYKGTSPFAGFTSRNHFAGGKQ